MANFQAADLFAGVRRLFVGLQGKKSDGQYEDIKTNDSGALQVSLTGSIAKQTLTSQVNIDPGMMATIMNFDADGFAELWISGNISGILNNNDREVILQFHTRSDFSGSNNYRFVSAVSITSETSQGAFWTDVMPVYERYGRIWCRNKHGSNTLSFRGMTLFLKK